MEAAASREPGSPRAVVVIPARLGSTRLARKMLLDETGTALVVHTARNATRCTSISAVVVATDSEEIEAVVAAAGIEVAMTSTHHRSGTDRVREALDLWTSGDPGQIDVVIGVQGDEPELDPEDLTALVGAFADKGVDVATLCHPIRAGDDPGGGPASSPHQVKVVRDRAGNALYFSRSEIPHGARAPGSGALALGHVGVYAWRPEALARFCALPPGDLEQAESLEQLRWLEAGGRMRVLDASRQPFGIDTQEDYAAFVRRTRSAATGDPAPPHPPSPTPSDPVHKSTS